MVKYMLLLLVLLSACTMIDSVTIDETYEDGNIDSDDITLETDSTLSCGDGVCLADENTCTCPEDCGVCAKKVDGVSEYACVQDNCVLRKVENICGNNVCEAGEVGTCIDDCPSCNDGNICTLDSYSLSNQSCLHSEVIPCCGNFKCESLGDEDSYCAIDCKYIADLDLSDYPLPFINNKSFETYLVIGSNASSELVISGIDIIRGLNYREAKSPYTTDAKLDTELSSITNRNVILIGNACQNKHVRTLMNPQGIDCRDGLKFGDGLIRLYKTGSDTYALVVAGYTTKDTRRAAGILEHYDKNSLTGMEEWV